MKRPPQRPDRGGPRAPRRPGPPPPHGGPQGPRPPQGQHRAKGPSPLPAGLRIVHEDDDLIVIDKPSGLLTSGLPGQNIQSAFNFVKDYVRDQARRRGTRVWIVHRLDKEASGLLIFAKTEKAFEWLKEEFRAKRAHRLYAAVVEGEVTQDAPPKPGVKPLAAQPASGTIQSFLFEDDRGMVASVPSPTATRRATRRDEPESQNSPKLAITHWRVEAVGSGRTMMRIRLETGRKNQIRVHMKEFGHPIVGDRRYNAATDPLGRVCLHAMELGITHPTSGQTVRWSSPTPGSFWGLVGKRMQTQEEPPAEAAPAPAAAPRTATTASSWDHVAEWYNELLEDRTSDHHERVIIPGTMRLLAPDRGRRILDVACGQGILCRRLAALGVSTVGVDASPRLIEAAKRAPHDPGSETIEYYVGDARSLQSLHAGTFDCAACIMALMNIDPLTPVLAGVAASLRPGGRFVAVILHPAFRAPGQTSWGWDEPRGQGRDRSSGFRQYRRVDGYLSHGQREIVMNPGAVAKGRPAITTITYHRPLQAYVKAFAEAGLFIDAIEEWPSLRQSEPGPRAAEENRIRREIPMFLAMRATAVAR